MGFEDALRRMCGDDNSVSFPTEELLDRLSVRTSYSQSMNKLNINDEFLRCVQADVYSFESVLRGVEFNKDIRYRVKTFDSILRKIQRSETRRVQSIFNDLLGLRIIVDNYPSAFPDYFRVVDMQNGKSVDDGYRAIHLYYKKSNYHYTIELQLWSNSDMEYNNWMHVYGYKTVDPTILKMVHTEYQDGKIRTFLEYVERIHYYETRT